MFRILIVEDSFLFRKLLKETLQSQFPAMEIIEATDGEEALPKIDSSNPHLVFMDIELRSKMASSELKRIKMQSPNSSSSFLQAMIYGTS